MKMYGTVEVQLQAFNTWGVVNLMAHLLTPWGRIGTVWVGGSAGASASLNPVEKRGRTFCSCWELNPYFLVILPVA